MHDHDDDATGDRLIGLTQDALDLALSTLMAMSPARRNAYLSTLDDEKLALVRAELVLRARRDRFPACRGDEQYEIDWRGCAACGAALGRDNDRMPEMGWCIVAVKGVVAHVPWFEVEWLEWQTLCGMVHPPSFHIGAPYPGGGRLVRPIPDDA